MCTADYPAAATYGPWVGSTAAQHPCRHCRWSRPKKLVDSDDEDIDEDEENDQVARQGALTRAQQLEQRGLSYTESVQEYTWAQVSSDIEEIKVITCKKDKKNKLSACGFNKHVFPLHPDYIPEVDPTRMQPQDIMHLFLCGITRHELYHLVEHLVKHKMTSWEAINSRVAKMRIPKGKRIPKLYPAAKGKKQGERHLDMTASEVLMFAKLRCVFPYRDSNAQPRMTAARARSQYRHYGAYHECGGPRVAHVEMLASPS